MRFNLSIAIVAMVGAKPGHGHGDHSDSLTFSPRNGSFTLNHHKSMAACSYNDSNAMNGHAGEGHALGEFHHWTEAEKGVILGSFFWGYVLTQMPGGLLSDKYGGKWPLGLGKDQLQKMKVVNYWLIDYFLVSNLGLLITAIFTILTPIAARTHTYLLIFCRVVQGLGEVFHVKVTFTKGCQTLNYMVHEGLDYTCDARDSGLLGDYSIYKSLTGTHPGFNCSLKIT